MFPDDDLFSLLRLHRALEAEPLAMAALLSHFGSAKTLFAEIDADWAREAGLPFDKAARLVSPLPVAVGKRLEADLRWLAQPGHRLLRLGDPHYPPLLSQISDPPVLLFAAGIETVQLERPQLAIVGSRKMTAAGRRVARSIAADLSRAGLIVTSGMARGIDSAAHEGALSAGGETVAVFGCGCDRIYPPSHRRLAEAIAGNGLVLSELPLGSEPRPWHFPRRNRIVTGMTLGTLVVEAALRSGSLISARLAAEQGREVFAVPGSIHGELSRGCHFLIKTGAKLVEGVDDILEELPGFETAGDSATACRPALPPDASPLARRLVERLAAEPMNADTLATELGVEITELLPELVDLEIRGVLMLGDTGYGIAGA